jgi:hypothetical protein
MSDKVFCCFPFALKPYSATASFLLPLCDLPNYKSVSTSELKSAKVETSVEICSNPQKGKQILQTRERKNKSGLRCFLVEISLREEIREEKLKWVSKKKGHMHLHIYKTKVYILYIQYIN